MCLDFPTAFIRNISNSKKPLARYDKMYIGLHVRHPLFLSDFNKASIF